MPIKMETETNQGIFSLCMFFLDFPLGTRFFFVSVGKKTPKSLKLFLIQMDPLFSGFPLHFQVPFAVNHYIDSGNIPSLRIHPHSVFWKEWSSVISAPSAARRRFPSVHQLNLLKALKMWTPSTMAFFQNVMHVQSILQTH